jgi:hypothetical protein
MHEFEINDEVEFRTFDGVEFRGKLQDVTENYFTIRTKHGTLGFPHEHVQVMWHAG